MNKKLLFLLCVMHLIALKSFSQPSFEVTPETVNFGKGGAGQTASMTFSIKNTFTNGFLVSIKNWQSGYIKSVTPRDVTLNPGSSQTFTVEVEFPIQIGIHYEQLKFTYSSSTPFYYGELSCSYIYLETVATPTAPTNLQATNITSTGCTLSWSAPSSGTPDGYNVYLGSTLIQTTTNLSVNCVLPSGTACNLAVKAYNVAGESLPVSITTLTRPAAPTTLTLSEATYTSFNATWSASTGANGYYVDFSSTGPNAERIRYITTATSYSFSNLSTGTTYSVSVRAYNATGESTTKITRSVITKPAAPTNFTAIIHSSTWVTLSWSPSYGANYYYVLWGGQIASTTQTSYDVYAADVSQLICTLWAVNNSGSSPHVILDLSQKTPENIELEVTNAQTDKLFLNNITLYPNPTQNTLNINLPSNLNNIPVSIYSIEGKLVLTKIISSDKPNLEVENLPKGYYIVRISGYETTNPLTFIKE